MPKDYDDAWIYKYHVLWNEQYLLEAFLSYNNQFRITAALNHLAHHYQAALSKCCPIFGKEEGLEPRSFWMQKN